MALAQTLRGKSPTSYRRAEIVSDRLFRLLLERGGDARRPRCDDRPSTVPDDQETFSGQLRVSVDDKRPRYAQLGGKRARRRKHDPWTQTAGANLREQPPAHLVSQALFALPVDFQRQVGGQTGQ